MTITCQQALVSFFISHIEKLKDEKIYWKNPIPKIEGFAMVGCASYKANVAFKEFVSDKIKEEGGVSNLSDKRQLYWTSLIVERWGGITNNKKETLEKYIKEIDRDISTIPLGGIASRSKFLSFIDTRKFAIYDARVEASLTAIQFLYDGKDPMAFSCLSGRNGVIKKFFYKGNPFVINSDINMSYKEYCCLLHRCLFSLRRSELYCQNLATIKLYNLEMALFYFAEQLCGAAAEKACKNNIGEKAILKEIICDAKTKMIKNEHTRLASAWLKESARLKNSCFGG